MLFFVLQGRRTGCYANACHPACCCVVVPCDKGLPISRLARTRHRSNLKVKFLHCCYGGCTTNSPLWSGGKTNARASARLHFLGFNTGQLATTKFMERPRYVYILVLVRRCRRTFCICGDYDSRRTRTTCHQTLLEPRQL